MEPKNKISRKYNTDALNINDFREVIEADREKIAKTIVSSYSIDDDEADLVIDQTITQTEKRWDKLIKPLHYFRKSLKLNCIGYTARKREVQNAEKDYYFTKALDSETSNEIKRLTTEIFDKAPRILTYREWQVFCLLIREHMSTEEVADQIDKSTESVRQAKSRALKKLRMYFDEKV